ncbi:MAG: hypothetical protein ACKVJU_16120 [Verrucomicrobiales bacterium]
MNDEFDKLENDDSKVSLIDVVGLHDIDLITKIDSRFKIEKLALEDVLNTAGRRKIEDFDDVIFVVVQMTTRGENEAGESEIDSQHFAMILLTICFFKEFLSVRRS